MTAMKRYRTVVFDDARWAEFIFRDDDIVISTPPRCGTTWMQTACAMLVLNTVEFDRPLAEISPWLDMQSTAPSAVLANLAGQQHRRIIKTHTPLDGLPFEKRATYLCVGRDPRDAAVSFEHHRANFDMGTFLAARAAAVGVADLADFGPPPRPPSNDPAIRFWQWAYGDGGSGSPTLSAILQHLQTFWDWRADPNIELFHYSDLLADLPGQFQRLASVLAVDLPDDRVMELAAAATYAEMKRRADDFGAGRRQPDLAQQQRLLPPWLQRAVAGLAGFGSAESVRRSSGCARQFGPAHWAHHGWLSAANRHQDVLVTAGDSQERL